MTHNKSFGHYFGQDFTRSTSDGSPTSATSADMSSTDQSDNATSASPCTIDTWESAYWSGIPTDLLSESYPNPVVPDFDMGMLDWLSSTFCDIHTGQDVLSFENDQLPTTGNYGVIPRIIDAPESNRSSPTPTPGVILHRDPFSYRRGPVEPRHVLELRARDSRFTEASWRIIEIMSRVKLYPGQSPEEQRRNIAGATHDLDSYIRSVSEDVSLWVKTQRYEEVGVHSAKVHAVTRRKHVGKKGLHICLWCHETITARINLANHVRSHLKLHLSFCAHCDFSSVSRTLPARHNCRKSTASTGA